MQDCMLHTTNIHINRKIFICLLSGNEFFVIVIVYITKEIPGRTGPLRHRVCLTFCISTADRTLTVHPLVNGSQWRLSCSGRLVGINLRKSQWEFFFRYRHISAVRAVNDRNRLTPVALT